MYEDDLSDLLPRLPTRQPALPSFSDEVDDPFKNPFSGTSEDPWASFGKPSNVAFDAWNATTYGDEDTPKATQDDSATITDALHSVEDVDPDLRVDSAVGEQHEVTGVEDAKPTQTAGKEKAEIVDPLDAALWNIEEPPAHVPVVKRKLPLLTHGRTSSAAEPSPTVTAPSEAKENTGPKDAQEVQLGSSPPEEQSTTTPQRENTVATPTAEAVAPVTPTIANPGPAVSETLSAAPQTELSVPQRPTLEVASSPSNTSFSGDVHTPPSREPSYSDAEGKSSVEKVAISPLERTPAAVPNPLDRQYSAPGGLSGDGWGDSWNIGSNASASLGYDPAYQEPHTETQPSSNGATEGETTTQVEQEDPDDDVPLAQSIQRPPPPVHMYVITVGDPQKVGDPISAHIIYTVQTRTTNQNYKKSQFSVLRRYSDFVWLYDTLCNNNPGVIVPPIPEKNSFGRFQDSFVAARRLALNKCIQKIANHPGLCNDKDLQLFLESDNFALDIKHRKTEENSGLLSMFSTSIASSKFYETDEWFETKRVYLDGLDNQLKGLVRSMEAVAKQRAEFSLALAELADTMEALSTADISKQLAGTFAHLAALQRKAKQLQDEQAQQDVVTFAGTVEEYGRMIGSVRVAFASRVKCFGQWQNAESDVRRVKAAHEKARKQSKTPERLHYHMQEVADAERRVIHTKSEFERVTKLVKIELHRFDMERVEDFKRSLEAFLDGMIKRQKELIQTWEEYQASLLQKSTANPTENVTDEEAPSANAISSPA